jgi:hypothetical protein
MSRTHDLRSWLRHVPANFDQFRRRVLDKVDAPRTRVALAAFSTSRTATADVEHRPRAIVPEGLRERPRDLTTVAEALATWEGEGGGLGHLKARALPGGARGPQARSPGGSVRQ